MCNPKYKGIGFGIGSSNDLWMQKRLPPDGRPPFQHMVFAIVPALQRDRVMVRQGVMLWTDRGTSPQPDCKDCGDL